MKWLSARTSNSTQEIYELWNNEEKILTLNYQGVSGTMRINCNDEKRVFLIGKEGFLKNKTVLRNEYGIKIARIIYENSGVNVGTLLFDDTRLFFSFQKHPFPGVILYTTDPAKPILSCELPPISIGSVSHEHLILALCWHSFISSQNRQVIEYA